MRRGFQAPRWAPFLLGAALASSCGGGKHDGAPSAAASCPSDGRISLTDDTNYAFSSSLEMQSTAVKDATDITFDWSTITTDFFGRPVDARRDINLVLISLWRMTESELRDNLRKDSLPLSKNLGVLTVYPDGTFTTANLLQFNSFKTPVDDDVIWSRFDTSRPGYAYPSDSHTFMLSAATGTAPAKNIRMLAFFKLDPASTNTLVALTNDSARLSYSVDLSSMRQVAAPTKMAGLTVDWSHMTTNAIGNHFDGGQITQASVAHFVSKSLPELQAHFLELETLADQLWSGEVIAGTSIDLSKLTDKNGDPFQGIDEVGVWMVALRCTVNCNNPAPWSIAVLKPCP